jgi:DNA-binding GntR family transcriptional regulator
MSDDLDRVTLARALLMQPLLRMVARRMPPGAMRDLRAELAGLRDSQATSGTPEARAMAEACDMALADLMMDDPPGMVAAPPSGRPN